VTVDLLADLYDAVHTYFYPLDMILPVLAAIESPVEKAQRVAALRNPVAGFDHRRLLDIAWQEQQEVAAGDVVVFRSVWQQHYKSEMTFDDFRVKLTALEALSRGADPPHGRRPLLRHPSSSSRDDRGRDHREPEGAGRVTLVGRGGG